MQVVVAVRANMQPDAPRKGRLEPAARRAPKVERTVVQIAAVDEGKPSQLALVRLTAVSAPTGGAPPLADGKDRPLVDTEQLGEREVAKGDVLALARPRRVDGCGKRGTGRLGTPGACGGEPVSGVVVSVMSSAAPGVRGGPGYQRTPGTAVRTAVRIWSCPRACGG